MTPSDRSAWLMLAVMGSALVLVLACTKPAGATHQGADHCDVDPTADQYIDIADLGLMAGSFGQPNALLDIAPDFGDGVVDISDIGAVAGVFGRACYGTTGTEGEAVIAGMSGCVWKTYGFIAFSDDLYAYADNWGGAVRCYPYGPGLYSSTCHFAFEALVNGQWQVVGVTGVSEMGGTYCLAAGQFASLPLYTTLRGIIWHEVRRDGFVVHGGHWHNDSYHFTIP